MKVHSPTRHTISVCDSIRLDFDSRAFFMNKNRKRSLRNYRIGKKFFICAFFLLGLSHSSLLTAQTRQLTGIVIDAVNEEPLVGATVYINEIKRGTAADKNGEFSFPGLRDGHYTATISYLGYRIHTEEITFRTGTARKIIIRLKEERKSLDEVIVTAKSVARQLREQALPVSVIKMEQIQGTVNNVQDVLAKTAGVTVRATGGVGSTSRISVRGLEGKRIGMFIDGNPMNDNSDFIDINDIPVEMIDRIEIYKGIVPAKFGGSAVGGAVNLVIREYPPKYLDANYTFGSFNTHKLSFVGKRNIATKGYEFGAGGFYTYSDNNYTMKSPFQDGLVIKRDHDQFRKLTLGGSFKARKWWFDLIEFEPVFLRTYKEIQGIEYNIQHAHSRSDAFIFANKMERENFLTAGLDLDWQLAYVYTDYQFSDTASYRTNWDGSRYQPVSQYGGEIGKWASLSRNHKHTFSHKLNLSYLIDKHHSLNFNSLFNFAHADPKDELKDKVIGYRTNFKSDMKSWVVGINYDYRTTNDRFLNSINLKYYYYAMQTKLSSVLTSHIEDIDTKKSNFGISNSMRYRLVPDLMVKASIGYDVRLPAEDELLGDGYVIAPAGNLDPERNTSINLGLLFDKTGKSRSNLQVEINGYYMYLQNMIRFTGGFLQSQYQNFGEMRTLGIEAEVKADITSWLYGYTNATYQDMRDTRKYEQNTSVPNPTKDSRMPNIPYFMANAGLEFHKENLFGGKGMNTRFFADGAFIDEYLYDFEQSKYQQRRIPRSLSFNAGFEQSFCGGRYFIMGRLNNLTNTQIISEFNRPLPGRNFSLRLRYVFK